MRTALDSADVHAFCACHVHGPDIVEKVRGEDGIDGYGHGMVLGIVAIGARLDGDLDALGIRCGGQAGQSKRPASGRHDVRLKRESVASYYCWMLLR